MTFSSWRKMLRSLESEGYEIAFTSKGHAKITIPGQPGAVYAPGTPGGHRTLNNTRCLLRRVFNAPAHARG